MKGFDFSSTRSTNSVQLTCILTQMTVISHRRRKRFSCSAILLFRSDLRWLDWIFLGGYLPSLNIKVKIWEKVVCIMYYINGEYYTVARRYEFYVRVARRISHK